MSLSEKQSVRSGSDVSSSVSVKSDRSKDDGPNFSEKTPPSVKSVRSGSHVSSSVSVKSDRSKDDGPNFNEKIPPSANRLQWETLDSDFHPRRNRNNFKDKLLDVFQDLESKIIKFLKDELEKFKKILQKENTQNFVKDFNDNRCSIKEAALDLTLHYLRDMKQDEAADTLEDELVFIHHLKYGLKKKYQCVFEGIAKQGDSTLLNNIYTDLYITQGGSERVNTEHEVRQIEVASRRHQSQEIPIECTKMFEAPEQDKEIRTVLTKGVAGIGKTISVQKFVLDWAEGKENQDISFIFPLPFREMNLKEIEKSSLMDLITQFFPETKGLNLTRRKNFKVLFILDGLDECRLPLKFDGNETWRDVSSPASLDVILTNLMKGNLLPSALIWITTRPAAASKIPPDCIDRVTEIRGFNDAQKEEYFRKRFTDEKMTNVIFDHVKKSKSLFIMCHIPVFCWISATVLQNILEEKINNDLKNSHADETSITLQESNTEDTPKTLTQMYAHFLRFQIQQSRRKYDGEYRPDVSLDKDTILSLGKLAFQQLERSNVIFYESDLEACGIDVYKASVCSGMCTQIFKEETGITLGTMYCFVHLSIQEFIAALYAHLFLDINKKSVFVQESTEQEYKNETMIDVLKTAVDKALKSDNGHLDLFLRFFLSLSLQSNRRLLQGLLTQQDGYDQSKKEIVQYIKQKLEGNLSPERSINLFYCLNELNDQTLVKEIQTQLREGSLSFADLSPAQWSALVFVLLTSEKELEEFELQKFKKSDECLIRLLAVIKTSKRALLNDSNLTDRSCSALATILGSDTELIELNMNNNNLQDSGLKLLCTGLKNIKCKLERLKLSDCSITEEGYKALASALRSNPSHLIELDLTGNDPGQSGVKELTDLLQDGRCTYIRFLKSPAAEEACEYLTEVLGKSPFLLTELDLSEDKLGDLDGEKKKEHLALLMDSHSKLETIKLNNCVLTEKSCSVLATVLSSKTILKELNLNNSRLLDSGVKQISEGLKNPVCELKILKLSDCSITEEGYKALASALRSNPSHLIELDLTGNDPGQSGVKELTDLLQDPNCQLKTIRFLKSPAAEEVCEYLTEVLGKSPLLLTELDLSEDKLGALDGEKLSALLMDSHCKLETIKLNNCELTEKSCSVLATVLSSKTILKELNLNNSRLLNLGVKQICEGLKNPVCELKILKLSDCSITEEGYKALASALRSNPSHLIELDLTGNYPGQSGVKELSDLLQDQNCQLKLRFLSPAADEACQYVRGIVGENPLLVKNLDLSKHKLGETRVNQIAALLQDKHCQLNKLQLRDCGLTEESCSALATVLRSNSRLEVLDISNNNLQDSGVKKLQKALEKTNCTLKKLGLSDCSITEEGYKALASALRSNPSHLIELDLTRKDPGQSGVKELTDLLQDPNCQLKLRFLSPAADEACEYVRGIVGKNPLLLRELNLSERELGDTGVNQIAALLKDKHCKLNTLILCRCSIKEKQCFILTSSLKSNLSHLRELNLSGNKLGDSGGKHLCDVLKDSHSKLERLRLTCCEMTNEGCSAVTSALKSNPSHLRELDLSGNKLGDSGVKHLSDVLKDSHCKLERLRLTCCKMTNEGCSAVTSALKLNPSHLRELDLSGNKLGDSEVKHLHDVLKDSHSKLERLRLTCCEMTNEGCSAVTSALKSHLRELDLSGNKLGDSGVNNLSVLLINTQCKLEKLHLCECSITEKQCLILTSALSINPSHLRELDLSGNEIKNTVCYILKDSRCKLERLSLNNCGITDVSLTQSLTNTKVLQFLKELDLRNNNIGDSKEQLRDVLRDSNCKLRLDSEMTAIPALLGGVAAAALAVFRIFR
ncbi:NLR family CARD domain-containing protein 3-like isoform X2 [Ctenopharyngodon idella]|uniref:NLR family CARD domain-containing protein 3-like isoform X2 n=1 Tax=Ctenopharyngodon idella TaxID=7959 RepID=UPI0022311F33|nr:NLR family CARD domain-containing protein 3-like isoform X2 [Ctenopharyngodon idella]XP_051749356.1 NLR family CARD domain-containing protein 3-like isoform X2 [Ctenopharyngodon idella]XP_051749357.1 NLR family CARD domain-containing protein 3-like isoform X2 [Ctenopharyngodon idella]